MHEEPIPSDTFLGIDAYDIIRQLAFAKRICKEDRDAMKRLRFIEKNTTSVLKIPVYELEYKLRIVIESGVKPLDVIAEANRARMEMYDLILQHQRVGLF